MNVFADLLTFLGQDKFQQFLQKISFGFFYDLHNIKIRCQLLCHTFLLEFETGRDDMFIINVNGTELRFDLKELIVVTDLKSGPISDFVSDPFVTNRLTAENFGEFDKVPSQIFTTSLNWKTFGRR